MDPAISERMIAAVIAAVDALPDVDFCLFPMSRHPFVQTHNDELLANRLAEERPRMRILTPPDDPAHVLAAFEAFSAVVAMRYHSLLFAERARIPLVPVAYADKCRHWLAEHDLEAIDPTPDAIIRGIGVALNQAIA